MRKLPARYAGVVMPFILTLLMTSIISFISTWRAIGLGGEFVPVWLSAWAMSWGVAFPTILVVFPLVRRLTALVVEAS